MKGISVITMDNELDSIVLDGQITVMVDDDYLWAKVIVTKPNGGKAVTYEEVMQELKNKGVVAHINEQAVRESVDYAGEHHSGVVVAEAVPPVNGKDGEISYSFDTKTELKPTIDEETGIVNFRELGKVRNIQKGTLIATIKANTMGTPGNDIRGNDIQCTNGNPPKYAVGTGTVLNNDQSRIYAASDGNLRWDKDKFVVDTVVTISGNVDASVGNIDFVGDVIIKGGISDGFRVKGKRIEVKQNVNNATVEASESLSINGGAVYAKLSCENDIKMSFSENSSIYCGGDLETKSLINCDVLCEGEVRVVSGKGVIIGGECIAYHNITANQVGSESYVKTIINLGNTAVLMKSHKELRENFKTLSENYNKLKTLYEKLNELRSLQELTDQQEHARKQAFKFIMNERNTMTEMTAKIDQNEKILAKSRLLKLVVNKRCYPGVTLKLYNTTYENQIENGACVYYLDSDNEIKFRAGTK